MALIALVADDGVTPLSGDYAEIVSLNGAGKVEVKSALFDGNGVHVKLKALTPFGVPVYKAIEVVDADGC